MSRLAAIRGKLNQLRMPELRNVLVDLNLPRAGRKIELVDRIAMALEVLFFMLIFASNVNTCGILREKGRRNNGIRGEGVDAVCTDVNIL